MEQGKEPSRRSFELTAAERGRQEGITHSRRAGGDFVWRFRGRLRRTGVASCCCSSRPSQRQNLVSEVLALTVAHTARLKWLKGHVKPGAVAKLAGLAVAARLQFESTLKATFVPIQVSTTAGRLGASVLFSWISSHRDRL
jgi:hypothetical protein